jgi:hypothetical protein
MVGPIVTIEGFGQVADILETMADKIEDLRPLWFLLANDFYKDQKRIFTLKGPGQYEDLADSTKDQKARLYGFIYPILKAEGNLEKSLTNPSDGNAVRSLTKQGMVIGTKDPKALFHHAGTKRMPARPLWEVEKNSVLGNRWRDTTDAYFEKALGVALKNPRRNRRNIK